MKTTIELAPLERMRQLLEREMDDTYWRLYDPKYLLTDEPLPAEDSALMSTAKANYEQFCVRHGMLPYDVYWVPEADDFGY